MMRICLLILSFCFFGAGSAFAQTAKCAFVSSAPPKFLCMGALSIPDLEVKDVSITRDSEFLIESVGPDSAWKEAGVHVGDRLVLKKDHYRQGLPEALKSKDKTIEILVKRGAKQMKLVVKAKEIAPDPDITLEGKIEPRKSKDIWIRKKLSLTFRNVGNAIKNIHYSLCDIPSRLLFDNSRIIFDNDGYECRENGPQVIALSPGDTHVLTVDLLLPTVGVPQNFRAAFIETDATKIFASRPIVIEGN